MTTTLGDIGSWASVIGLPFGVLVGSYFYYRSRQITSLAYQIEEWTVVGDNKSVFPDDVEIRYHGRGVPRVTKTHLIFWNDGTQTIRDDQIVAANPLVLDIKNGEFLRIERVKTSRLDNGVDVNNVEILEVGASRLLRFDYLDPRDGATFRILHTGEKKAISITGSVQGLPSGVRRRFNADDEVFSESTDTATRARRMLLNLAMGMSGQMIGVALIAVVIGFINILVEGWQSDLLILFPSACLVAIGSMIFLHLSSRPIHPPTLTPD